MSNERNQAIVRRLFQEVLNERKMGDVLDIVGKGRDPRTLPVPPP